MTIMKRTTKLIVLGLVIFAVATGLGVGLGVGLTRSKDTDNEITASSSSEASTLNGSSTAISSSSSTGGGSGSDSSDTNRWWKPSKETTWDYSLRSPPTNLNSSIAVYGVDLFDTSAEDIRQIKHAGHKVICYFSAGSYENWRPDKSSFKDSDLGNDLVGWQGEKWINISSSSIRNIMTQRIKLAVNKSCDGVDPDNLDGYGNENGLKLTEQDSVDYITFLSHEAHSRNLSIGLKNCGSIVDSVIDHVEWVIQELCIHYDECEDYTKFITNNKPVFNVEYPKGDDTNNDKNVSTSVYDRICNFKSAKSFSTILKNMDLDSWIQSC